MTPSRTPAARSGGRRGDIAPFVPITDPLGLVFKGTLVGLLAVIALGALFITAEYRRNLIRTTITRRAPGAAGSWWPRPL